jgi:DNA-binding NtrC family response regulator
LATLNEGVLESELFGHEKGSFTGADQKRIGKLELAQGGTVFLDEVGELPLRLQARLLEFLQSRTISPVGSNREVRLNVRIIVATHRDLKVSVSRGEFREDLFHRLRVIAFQMKALRERAEDFDLLVHQAIREFCQQSGKTILRLSEGAAEVLEKYSWPGNIRELRNVLEYAVMASETQEIGLSDLPGWMMQSDSLIEETPEAIDGRAFPVLGTAQVTLTLDYRGTFQRFEKEYLQRALSRNGGRINRTAREIGLNKTTLLRRARAYRLYPCHQPSTF